jgi:hypothetical protein
MFTCDDQPHKPYHVRVYTPDGGIINCSSVADAQRVAYELNKAQKERDEQLEETYPFTGMSPEQIVGRLDRLAGNIDMMQGHKPE